MGNEMWERIHQVIVIIDIIFSIAATNVVTTETEKKIEMIEI